MASREIAMEAILTMYVVIHTKRVRRIIMRKLLSLGLVVAMAASMTACGSKATTETTAAAGGETTKAAEEKAGDETTKAAAEGAAAGGTIKIGGIGPVTGGAAIYGLHRIRILSMTI